jgi:AcrR family transcriptional regulator
MSINLHADPRTNSVLNAALAVFARYGFKRVSMEDIAGEAGLSRPLLYLIYPNKTAIFSALARAMAHRAKSQCEAAWPETELFDKGFARAGIALNLDAWRLIKGSAHGGELMADNSSIAGQISLEVETFFVGLIERRLVNGGYSGGLARMLASAIHGIKDKATSEEELIAQIEMLASVLVAGSLTPESRLK